MLPVPYDMGGMPMRDAALSQSIPVGALATALANATPDQQRTVCPIPILFAYSFLI
jgi:polyadenylate-binding protein